MLGIYRWILAAFIAMTVLVFFVGGCADERREVTYTEETHEGEVVEEPPGEMVVE